MSTRNPRQKFEFEDVISVEVESSLTNPSGLTNYCPNPNPDTGLGTWSWTGTNSDITTSGAAGSRKFVCTATTASTDVRPNSFQMKVSPGEYVSARWDLVAITAGLNIKPRWHFYSATGALLSGPATGTTRTALGTYHEPGVVVPANAVKAALILGFFNGTSGAPGIGSSYQFNNVMMTKASTNSFTTTVTNLVSNPSFETNTTGWIPYVASNMSIARSSAQAFVGSWSLLVTRTAVTSNYGNTAQFNLPLIPGAPGQSYTFSAHIRAGNAAQNNARIWVRFKMPSGFQDAYSQSITTSTSAWQRVSVTATAPSTTTSVEIYVDTGNDQTVGRTAYVDGVMVTKGSTLYPYFDGATTDTGTMNYSWTGTAHGSTSTYQNTNYEFVAPFTWSDITPACNQIDIVRGMLDASTCTVAVVDPSYDPADNPDSPLKVGKRLRIRTRDDLPSRTNLITNPSFETNTTGWSASGYAGGGTPSITRVTTGTHRFGVAHLVLASTDAKAGARVAVPVGLGAVGTTVTFSAYVNPGANPNLSVYLSGGNGSAGGGSTAPMLLPTNEWTRVSFTVVTTSSSPAFEIVGLDGVGAFQLNIDGVMLEKGSTVGDYIEGTVSASGTLYTGFIRDAVTEYDEQRKITPIDDKRRIIVRASDIAAELSSTKYADGVSSVPNLAYTLMQARLAPYVVNNLDYATGTPTVVIKDANASVMDQIIWTRDSNPGTHAWICTRGQICIKEAAYLPSTPKYAYTDTDNVSYTEIDMSWSSEHIINSVVVVWNKYNSASGETEQITYGPFQDPESIFDYGVRESTFEIIGASVSSATAQTLANTVLVANANPERTVRSIDTAVLDISDVVRAVNIELAEVLSVSYEGLVDEQDHRVQTIEHHIGLDGWTSNYGFMPTASVATPLETTIPTAAGNPGGWVTLAKVSPSASMVNITVEYRITGNLIEWRTSGNTAAAISIPASGDIVNQNITTGIPSNLCPEQGNWSWFISHGRAGFLALTFTGSLVFFATVGSGTVDTLASGTPMLGQSPAFVLP